MRRNLSRTIESIMLVVVLMPAGMLLAHASYQPPAVTSTTANWFDVEQASNLLHQMQTRALGVRRAAARLQVQGIELGWRAQSSYLAKTRNDVNIIGNDLVRLDQMKNKLEPWQQSLVHKITPALHEMVYQTDAAIHRLNAHQNRTYLSLTQYPQSIDQIYENANQVANTIQTVTQYAHAEQKMAELNKMNRAEAGS